VAYQIHDGLFVTSVELEGGEALAGSFDGLLRSRKVEVRDGHVFEQIPFRRRASDGGAHPAGSDYQYPHL
jgi:hypothetical protein